MATDSPHAVLGVNFSGADPNAALVVDGRIVAAVEEERFVRDKHAVDRFPTRSVGYCLEQAARAGRPIERVAIGWDLDKYSGTFMEEFYEREVNTRYPVDDATRGWQRRMIATFRRDTVEGKVAQAFAAAGVAPDAVPPLSSFGHHHTHAAGAYLLSRFDEAVVITLDGSGDELCAAIWHGRAGEVRLLHGVPIPHSLGWFYAALTEYLGFRAYDGEYKVMGLAPYGEPDATLAARLRKVLAVEANGDYRLDPTYIHYGGHSWSGRYTDALVDLLGDPPRTPETEPSPFHKRLAFEGQALFEEAALGLARRAVELAGTRNVCLAGGAALNCKMSQRLLTSGIVDDVFVLPNAGDGGQALSAAVLASTQITGRRPEPLTTLALGPMFDEAEIKATLDDCLLESSHETDVARAAAADLAAGKVVGWFQGRMEFGPRALGQRSILADPRRTEARDRVNRVIKYREYWRPFCPSLPAEEASRYFSKLTDARFMAITLPVAAEHADEIAAVVHVDRTSRPQLVHAESHPMFHSLLRRFGELTGVPVLLNTSFNVRGEPIVCTPRDALRNFYTCGMDVLYLGPFRLRKPL